VVHERKVKFYNGYFINRHVFHIKEYGQGKKTYNSGVCVKGLTSNEFEVNYYEKLEEVMILFKCYWHDTTDKEIRVDLYHGLVEINTKPKLRNIDDIFFFPPINSSKFIHSFLVQDGNDELTVGDDVFQLDELVDLYRISSFNDLEETSNFHVVENTFVDIDVDVDVDVEELYNILKTSRHTQVNEDDDNDEINIEDYNEYNNDEIE